MNRRDLLMGGAVAVAGAALARGVAEAQDDASADAPPASDVDGRYRPVVTPNGSSLPFRMVGGVKVFHLVAEPVHNVFTEGLEAHCWGYNGSTPGPTLEAVEGDRVRIYVTNRLPEPTTVHWHGVILPSGMDGVGGLSQHTIPPVDSFRNEFTFPQAATYMYNRHWDEITIEARGGASVGGRAGGSPIATSRSC